MTVLVIVRIEQMKGIGAVKRYVIIIQNARTIVIIRQRDLCVRVHCIYI